MVRYFGLFLIFISCLLVGYSLGESLKKRRSELREFENTLMQLKDEIIFIHTPLPEAFMKISLKCKEPLDRFYSKLSEILLEGRVESVYCAFKETLEDMKKVIYLEKADIEILLDFSKNLGELDTNYNTNLLDMALKRLNVQIKELEDGIKNNIKLYKYLGFSIGAMIVIFLL